MKRCRYCRCEFEGAKCPSCGGSGKEISSGGGGIISGLFSGSSSSSSSHSYESRDEFSLGTGIIGRAQSIARTIRYAIKTWIVCIILGLILSHFMDEGKIAFLEENHDIFVYVKNILLYFGWAVGIVLSKIRRYI